MDADSLVVPDALTRVVQTVLDEPGSLVACGVQVAVANGLSIRRGQVTKVGLPRSWVARVQVVEYMRTFTQSRTALGRLNMLLVLSGVFAVFRRDLLLDVGAFLTPAQTSKVGREYCGEGASTVSEDMEVVVRIHRYLMDRDRVGRLLMIPEPLVWTETPETFANLGRQRARWYRGLLECLSLHRQMVMRRRYGAVGWLSLPYQALFEAAAPFIELAGWILLPVSVAIGVLDLKLLALFLGIVLGANLLLSIGSVLVATWAETARGEADPSARLFTYSDPLSITRLVAAAFVENLGYRQIVLYWRLRGLVDFLRGKKVWDKFGRVGFGAEEAAGGAR